MDNRRQFIEKTMMAAGFLVAGGCRSLANKTSFYGPTIRDRLWMWGHHAEARDFSFQDHEDWKWKGPAVEQAEGCRLMGVPNDCFIRWRNMPAHPWGDYVKQFHSLKRFAFGITDGGNGTIWDKLDWAITELKPEFPNLTGCFLDDFFCGKTHIQPIETIRTVADRLHENDLRLSVVVYSDQNGIKPEFKPYLDLCDETTFWCWRSANLDRHEAMVRRMRDFIGGEKSLLMGVYMWDYTLGEPVSVDRMRLQLAFAEKLLADRTIDGLIFHPTYAAALDKPAVNLAKAWIRANGEKPWGSI